MILQESRPNQHIGNFSAIGYILCIRFPRPHGAKIAISSECIRSGRRRIRLPDRIENVLHTRSDLFDLLNDLWILVIKDMFGAVGADQIGVLGTACCYYV